MGVVGFGGLLGLGVWGKPNPPFEVQMGQEAVFGFGAVSPWVGPTPFSRCRYGGLSRPVSAK